MIVLKMIYIFEQYFKSIESILVIHCNMAILQPMNIGHKVQDSTSVLSYNKYNMSFEADLDSPDCIDSDVSCMKIC